MSLLRRLHQRVLFSPRISASLAIVIVLTVILWGVPYTINRPVLQHAVLRLVNTFSDWRIEAGRFTWYPWQMRATLEALQITNEHSGHQLSAATLAWRYRPLALLRGIVRITELDGTEISLQLAKLAASTKARAPLSLRQFLLLEHLQCDRATLQRIDLALPNQTGAQVDTAQLSFTPGWFGTARLRMQLQNTVLQPANGAPATFATLTLGGDTVLSRWLQHAPYVNDLTGTLEIERITWKTLTADRLTAQTTIRQGRISLSTLQVLMYERTLTGAGHLEFGDNASALELSWPEPLPIPELLPDTSFWRTAGTLQGNIHWEGNVPTLLTPTGTLQVDLTHTPTDVMTIPAQLTATADWQAGLMRVRNGRLRVGDGDATLGGTIDLPNRRLDLTVQGRELPILGVLGRFRNTNYHPIIGNANCDGHFRGWARDFTFDLTAATAGVASYQGIAIDAATVKMQLTYPKLTLHGEIAQEGRTTGEADLSVVYGPKPADGGSRPSTLQMTATVTNHPLARSFALYGLAGTGSGQIRLHGPTMDYRGEGTITIDKGSWYTIPFDQAHTNLRLRPQEIVWGASQIYFPDLPLLAWPGTLRMSIGNGFHMTGSPAAGAQLDFAYNSLTKGWTFRHLTWTAPGGHRLTLTGTGRTNAWDLRVAGTADAAWLRLFPASFREAHGDLPVDLRIRGNLERPIFSGTIGLRNNAFVFRALPHEWNRVQGTLTLADNRAQLHAIQGEIGDGPFTLDGWATLDQWALQRYQLRFTGTGIPWASDDRTIRADLDVNTTISRLDSSSTTIAGDLFITNALYRRDFLIFEQAARSERLIQREKFRQIAAGWDHVRLDLNTRSRGDLRIRNNVATASLRANVRVTGTAASPIISGAIETTEGQLQYLGLQFALTHGVIDFHAPSSDPSLDFIGEENIGAHRVQINLHGPASNLRVDLSATPGEDRKNILCLIGYGVTCDQLRSAQFGAKLGPSVLAEQLARILAHPIRKATGLDVVRIESAVGTSDLSKLHIGKQITERFELGFVTTVGQSIADQSIEAAYKVTDNLLFKMAQSARNNTEAKISVRLRER